MLESKIQSKLIKNLEKEGAYVIKLISTNKNGIADLLSFDSNNVPTFIEVKQQGKKPRPLQIYRAKELKERGIRAVWYDGEYHEYDEQ